VKRKAPVIEVKKSRAELLEEMLRGDVVTPASVATPTPVPTAAPTRYRLNMKLSRKLSPLIQEIASTPEGRMRIHDAICNALANLRTKEVRDRTVSNMPRKAPWMSVSVEARRAILARLDTKSLPWTKELIKELRTQFMVSNRVMNSLLLVAAICGTDDPFLTGERLPEASLREHHDFSEHDADTDDTDLEQILQ